MNTTSAFVWLSFKEWLIQNGKSVATANSINSRIKRIKEEYSLEYEYAKDGCTELLKDFTYTKEDAQNGLTPHVMITISGDYLSGLRSLKSALILYVEYLDTYTPTAAAPHIPNNTCSTSGCIFEGSFSEFNRFTGPCWRNKIQIVTKAMKKKTIVCECCQKKKELHAAHKRGFERIDIIRKILTDNYEIANDRYRVDLVEFETKFLDAHKPYEDMFYFLCQDCHKIYDNEDDLTASNQILTTVLNNRKNNTI